MTVAEYAELFVMNQELVSMHAMNLSAMVFAYLVAAQFAGAKISKVQVYLLTLVYSAFLMGPFFQYLSAFNARYRIRIEIEKLSPEIAGAVAPNAFPFSQDVAVIIACTIFITGWAASIVYMFQIRKKHASAVST